MYVTRALSMYRKSPSTLSIPTPDAPHSGYLVITDEEAEADDSFCWGLCRRHKVKNLPFPQDRVFTITHSSEHHRTSFSKVVFIPVLDHPLSSNRYYVVKADGRHKGYVCMFLLYVCMSQIAFTIYHVFLPWVLINDHIIPNHIKCGLCYLVSYASYSTVLRKQEIYQVKLCFDFEVVGGFSPRVRLGLDWLMIWLFSGQNSSTLSIFIVRIISI